MRASSNCRQDKGREKSLEIFHPAILLRPRGPGNYENRQAPQRY
jgi:hypothetical protein